MNEKTTLSPRPLPSSDWSSELGMTADHDIHLQFALFHRRGGTVRGRTHFSNAHWLSMYNGVILIQ